MWPLRLPLAKAPCQERPVWLPKLLNLGYLRKQPCRPSVSRYFTNLGPVRPGAKPCPHQQRGDKEAPLILEQAGIQLWNLNQGETPKLLM